jgi:hypothetical protein
VVVFWCTATVIAGTAFGVTSPVYTRTPTSYLDFKMSPGSTLTQVVVCESLSVECLAGDEVCAVWQSLPSGWNSFVYVLSGDGKFGPAGKSTVGPAHHTLLLSNNPGEDGLFVEAGAVSGVDMSEFVYVCGQRCECCVYCEAVGLSLRVAGGQADWRADCAARSIRDEHVSFAVMVVCVCVCLEKSVSMVGCVCAVRAQT